MDKEHIIWPNFFIVGASKAGTTSAWAYLRKHPQIFLPRMKEPSYFVSAPQPPGLESYYCTANLTVYRELYKNAAGYKAIGDASTAYLWDREVAARLHAVAPQARIVILLRDPVERAYSQYCMLGRANMDPLPFAEAVHRDNSESVNSNYWWNDWIYVERGLYYEQVRRYIELFGREQVGIFFFEDLAKDPLSVMQAICRHIGVDPALLDPSGFDRAHNASLVPRSKWLYDLLRFAVPHGLRRAILPIAAREWLQTTSLFYRRDKPPIDAKTARYLQSIYEPDLCRLEELLGRKLPQLRAKWKVDTEEKGSSTLNVRETAVSVSVGGQAS